MKKIVNDEPAQVEDGGERAAGGGGGGVVAEAEKYNVDQKYSGKIWMRNIWIRLIKFTWGWLRSSRRRTGERGRGPKASEQG